MKNLTKYTSLLLGLVLAGACASIDYPDRFKETSGVPTVNFIRYADRDIVITQAAMEETICIVGENLTSVHDIYFNDQPAVLNSSYMTANTIVLSVPKNLPVIQDDQIHLITRDSSVVLYDFKVVKVTTASGTGQSVFMYKDTRGMLFNFDTDPHPANHGWHAQVIETDDTALSGNFLRLGAADVTLDEEGGWNDGNFSFEYWPGDWDDPVTYADSPRLTEYADFEGFKNMALKFELFIPSSNPWKSGAMQLIIGGVDLVTGGAAGAVDIYGNVTAGANNTFISGDAPRALYIPWKNSGSFDTGDKWITVTVPYTEFGFKGDGTASPMEVKPNFFTSLTIFVWNGGVVGTACNPIIKIDNLRAVPIK